MTSTSAVAASPFATSSTARAVVARLAPTPPSAAGTVRLPSPVAHTAATLSCEDVLSRSCRSALPAIWAATSAAAATIVSGAAPQKR